MIPKLMEIYLRERLPERTWKNRLVRQDGKCFMEFYSMDVERLSRLDILVDRLGPKLVACMWDETSPLEVGGYLVVDNLAMGRPAMGGIRMLPNLTPQEIFNRARGMTFKNAAAYLPYGGGKAGIFADPDSSSTDHAEIIRSFARLLSRYTDIFLPGPDVSTDDVDMRRIAVENGLDNALSKPAEMGGVCLSELGAAGGGLAIALKAMINELPRLRVLPQFATLSVPDPDKITVLLQGFGTVGSHAARLLKEHLPGARVIGISDSSGYLYNEFGLPVNELFELGKNHAHASQLYFRQSIDLQGAPGKARTKYSNQPDDLLRESAFCFIPAAPVANYLDTDPATHPTMTVDHMGRWSLIIEGANTYSQDSLHQTARARMERAVYRERGIMIATDYLVNSGAVIYAAQEHLIKTPAHLRIPEEMLGNPEAVDTWLKQHSTELEALAERRRQAGEAARDEVIRRNMTELVNSLILNADLLPSAAAEQISIRRITQRERARTARDIMERLITIPESSTVQQAAQLIIETGCPILAVVDQGEGLVGVVTDWDITNASAEGRSGETPLSSIMTREVITAMPGDTILELVRKLEHYEISAMPVVENGSVLGVINTDVLARRSLYPLLIAPQT